MNELEQYKVAVPEGAKGQWRIQRFTITQEKADHYNFRQRFNNHGIAVRDVVAGTYTKLSSTYIDPMMSDTPAEITDHLYAIEKAKGHVLITGLGIGMVINACLKKTVKRLSRIRY